MRIPKIAFFFPVLTFFAIGVEGQVSSTGAVPPALPAALQAPAVQEPAVQTVAVTAQATLPEPPVSLQARPAIPIGPDYRIGPGDILRVSVFEEPQFTTSAVVRPDGKISIPLLSDLAIAGMTPEAAQGLVTDQLGRFIKHPRVTVIVEEIHSRIVYVTGEIQHPGAYPLLGPLNVVQLIARAGGPTEFARKKEVYVLHQDGGSRVKVNYQMVLAGKHLEENIGLQPGDTVVVP